MQPEIGRPANELVDVTIEDLSPATIEGVADRLVVARTFVEFVYREAEMDALFSLADIALHTERATRQAATLDGTEVTASTSQHLAGVRDLIFSALDLGHDGHVVEAAELLRQAARLIATAPAP